MKGPFVCRLDSNHCASAAVSITPYRASRPFCATASVYVMTSHTLQLFLAGLRFSSSDLRSRL